MSGTSVASRRFYSAFYEWTLLTAPVGVSLSGASLSGARGHGYYTKSRYQDGEPQVTIRRMSGVHPASAIDREPRTRRTRSVRARGKDQTAGKAYQRSRIEKWKTAQVQTATVKPFSSLLAEEAIVRHRSEYGLMIEYAALDTDLERMQKTFGPQLEALSRNHGARLEVQKLSAPARVPSSEDARIVSVLVSGTFSETAAVYTAMRSFASSRAPPGESTADTTRPRLQIFSHLVRPSSSLTPKQVVYRELTDDSISIEVSMSEGDFMRFVAASSINSITKKFSVSAKIGEPEPRPVDKTSPETSMARSFLVSGPVKSAHHAKDHILSFCELLQKDETPSMETATEQSQSSATARQAKATTTGDAGNKDSDPGKSSESGSFGQSFGTSAEQHEICHARIIGPNAKELRGLLFTDNVGHQLHDLRRHIGLETLRLTDVENGLVAAGLPSKLGRLQRKLRNKVEETYKAKDLAAHTIEFSTTSLAEHARQQSSFTAIECRISGPKYRDLWTTMLPKIPEGWRNMRGKFVHISKGKHNLELYGQEGSVSAVADRLSYRIRELCKTCGYPAHKLQRLDASPQHVADLIEEVRNALRTVTHPVVVITSRDTDPQHAPGNHGRATDANSADSSMLVGRGVTVSSFNTVTLKPHPMVSFNLKLPSRSWDAIKRSFAFSVHILPGNPRGAAIAHSFTRTYEEPFQGFKEISKMGGRVVLTGNHPPYIHDDNAGEPIATLLVDLHLEKCVEVEDHIIVVGKVRTIWPQHSDGSALSYTMGGYRGADGQIDPDNTPILAEEQEPRPEIAQPLHSSQATIAAFKSSKSVPDDELDPLRLGEEYDPQPNADDTLFSKRRTQRTEQVSSDDEEPLDDPVYRALAATRDEVRREEQAEAGLYEQFNNDGRDIAPAEQKSTDELAREAKRRAALREEEEYDFGFDEPEHGNKSFMSNDAISDASLPGSHPSYRPAHAWGLPSSISKRSYSSFAPPLSILGVPRNHIRRFVSTSATRSTFTNDLSHVLDPSVAQSTVSDYLSLPENPHDKDGRYRPFIKQRSVRGAMKDKRDIQDLKDLLSKGYNLSRSGEEVPLTCSEISNMDHKITVLERKVAVTLAMNAMWHLKAMLDKARYTKMFWQQVPFLENLIEHGMATLMADARDLRLVAEEGKIERERYEYLSKRLKGRYEGMEVETGRLRQITEEEGDGGVREDVDDEEEEDW